MVIRELVVGPLQVNCFVLGCEKSNKAAVIDPGGDPDRIVQLLQKEGWTLTTVINTHGHFDHVGGNAELLDKFDAALLIHQADVQWLEQAASHAQAYGLHVAPSPQPSKQLQGGESIEIGEMSLQVLHTPGHSPGCISLYTPGHLFCGDTLFAGSVGRTDLPGGDFNQLVDSIHRQLWPLPDETIVYTGHGPKTTIAREKKTNPFVGVGA